MSEPAQSEPAQSEPAQSEPVAPEAVEIGYADALEELEGILSELEDDAIDIDVLSDRVERAAELIKICRSRISVAQNRVSSIVEELDALASDSGDA